MTLLELFVQLSPSHVGVHLGGGNTRVTQQLLNVAQGCAVLEQMSGEAMTQRMGCDALPDACLFAVVLHDVPDPLAGQSLASVVHEQGYFCPPGTY